MNPNVIAYLQQNKEKFAKEVLIGELEKAGYAQSEIQEAAAFVYGEKVSVQAVPDFWDFKTIKIYTKPSEKWKDFLFGFFAPFLLGIFGSLIPIIGPIILLSFYIFALAYLFKRRRYIFYGMLMEIILMPVVVLVVLISLFGRSGW